MTQELYIKLRPIRFHLDKLMDDGSCNMPHDHEQILQDAHKELFGSTFKTWCDTCISDAMKAVFYQFDQYQEAEAPVIITSNKTAKRVTKKP